MRQENKRLMAVIDRMKYVHMSNTYLSHTYLLHTVALKKSLTSLKSARYTQFLSNYVALSCSAPRRSSRAI